MRKKNLNKKEKKMRTQIRKDKIQEALELLNDAAQEKKDEVYELLGSKYESLKEVFENAAENGHELVGEAKKRIAKGLHAEEKKIKEIAAEMDKKIRRKPWVVLGSVALGSLVLGLIFGGKK